MAKRYVPLIVGEMYHVFNRGVDKRDVFLDKNDYLRFYMCLDLFNSKEPIINFRLARSERRLIENITRLVEINAYSLLPNHFHLIITPLVEGGVSEFLRRVTAGYTSYFNEKNARSGALFQGTFKRVHIVSQEQYQYVFAYVNENHSVHGIKVARQLFHSSSLHYQGLVKSKLLAPFKSYYDIEGNTGLAIEIYNRRKGFKNSDLLEV